jgi:uncharacterized protein (TIGR01777 family)
MLRCGSVRILVGGASGLVGSALVPALRAHGHEVHRLVRPQSAGPRSQGDVEWDPSAGRVDAIRLEGFDGVVNLAGENIADHRWSPQVKERLMKSRVDSTGLLASTLARMPRPPEVLVQASAIGLYGDRGEELLTETSGPGKGFLPELCVAWEGAARPAVERGVRVAFLRFGVVLSPRGGALAKMLPPFQMGVGGIVGDGRQWMSWLAVDDAAGMIEHVLLRPEVRGPVNAVAPTAIPNREFTYTLARVLGRPAIVPVPAFALRLMFGDLADEALLASLRVAPKVMRDDGYEVLQPALEPALRHLLGALAA